MTAAAVGIGWLSGGYLNGRKHDPAAAAEAAATPAASSVTAARQKQTATARPRASMARPSGRQSARCSTCRRSPPTRRARATSGCAWSVASCFDEPPRIRSLADAIHQDLLAFVRTVKMHQIEGASGFQHLKADLEERASIRSGGHAKQVLIRTLLFE